MSSAIQIAKKNSTNLGIASRAKFKVSDICNYKKGKYDLIISNPPYIPSKEINNLSKDIIDYEPIIALDGGMDGLDLIKKVIYKSSKLLKNDGLLIIEIGYKQYLKVSRVLAQFNFREIDKVYDYGDNVRCIISTRV